MTGKPVLMLGAGGHAKVLIEALRLQGATVIGILDRDLLQVGHSVMGVPILGEESGLTGFDAREILVANGLGSTGNPAFNGMWTLLGVPCVTLPLLRVDGMPCGVQLIGKRRDEGRLLAHARWLEETIPPS